MLFPLRQGQEWDPRGLLAASSKVAGGGKQPLAAHTASPYQGGPLAPVLTPPTCVCGAAVSQIVSASFKALLAALLQFQGSPA